jgi:two-component system cell cycle sensor histidine kinase/response regulator CckA
MPTPKRPLNWVNTLLVVASVTAILLSILGGHTAWIAAETSDEIVNESQILQHIRGVLEAMKDAETGQRGFLITGDEKYAERFHIGLSQTDESLAKLKRFHATGHLENETLAALQRLVEEKTHDLRETVEARRSGPDEEAFARAREIVITDRGKLVMDQLRLVTAELIASQDDKLEALQSRAAQLAGRHSMILAVGLVLTLGTFLAAAVATNVERTDRNRIVQRLQTERARHVAVIDASMDAVVAVDHRGRILMLNPIAEVLFQRRERDVSGYAFTLLIAEPFRAEFLTLLEPNGTTKPARSLLNNGNVFFGLRADGVEFPAEAVISHSIIDDQELFTIIVRDVTERETGRTRMREQTAILSLIREAIHIRDMNDRILTWNDGAKKLYGWSASDAVGKIASTLIQSSSSVSESQILSELLLHGAWIGERDVRTMSGEDRIVESRRSLIVDDKGRPGSQLVIDIDVTEERRREQIERRSQRLESIGTLTSGIAHDLNNVLTPITMGARLLRSHITSEHGIGLVNTIAASADRGAAMIQQLLSFAGGTSGTRVLLDLKLLIEETCGILRHTLSQAIRVESQVAADLWTILGESTELSQVLMNLSINARDAMPRGGTLTIAAENVAISGDADSLGLSSGRHICVSVTDTGVGIPHRDIERIFDPFFTTKDQGKGTGLGLATCMGIVRSHGGNISVSSEMGIGTKFALYLPAQIGNVENKDQTVCLSVPSGTGEFILLVDDEESILLVAKATLEGHGYRALTAVGGEAAIALFKEHHNSIDAVVVDMMMPKPDGAETIKSLRAICPGIPIIASSGLRRPDPAKGNIPGSDGFLSKPYNDEQLLRSIKDVLNSRQTPRRTSLRKVSS